MASWISSGDIPRATAAGFFDRRAGKEDRVIGRVVMLLVGDEE
jgi:hypothetical protein